MKKIFSSPLLYPTILGLIIFVVCFQNFTPGTFLAGWDNLIPELNIWLNIKRSFFSVWQEYQGLGLVGGMGHATELIHQLLILPLTFVLPANFIRYLWQFLMLFLGTFGIYFGIKNTLKFPGWISFCAAIFYLFNFGSIQLFWVPFESFSTFWGFFPWLIFSLWEHVQKPSRLSTFRLLTFNLLAVPAFYVQTIFVVYILCLFIILFSHFIFHLTDYRLQITNYLNIILLILAINSFWLLPFGYFLKNNSQNPRLAIGNYMANEETFERNQRRGYLEDFVLLRGYYYDFPDSNGALMGSWISHFSNQYTLLAGYLIAFFVILGLISLLAKYRHLNGFTLSCLLLLLLVSLALLSATPPFLQINSLIRQISFIDQVFRSPWTKFIVPAIFIFTILTAYGLQAVINISAKLKYSSKAFSLILFTVYGLLITVYIFPVFTGNYISPKMRVNIPSEYISLFDYFKSQPSTGRIMNLPQGSFWGWTNYSWQLSGSGFLWYAIPQPILDRAFDVWEQKNENYYFELTYALQQKNSPSIKKILDKYSIEYIIFDDNVIFPDEKIYAKLSTPTKDLLDQIPELLLAKKFGKISVYHYQTPTSIYSTSTTDLPATPVIGKPILPDFSLISSNPILPTSSLQLQFDNTLSSKLTPVNFPNVTFNQNYLLKITSKNIAGHPLTISAVDNDSHYKFLFNVLPKNQNWTDQWYLIPQMESTTFNQGLTVLFNNPSYNYSPSINAISNVALYTYSLPAMIDFNQHKTTQNSNSHLFFYKTIINNQSSDSTLVLPQSFSSGWLAFYFENNQIKFLTNHVLINNWANGYKLPITDYQLPITIYLFFWPQLLESLGFGLLITGFIWIIKTKSK